MKNTSLFLGIDTSCYTTSVAVCDGEKNIIINSRNMLPVKQGDLGLRQSEAVFAHIKNLNSLFKSLDLSSLGSIKKICVSSTPRKVEGSYMPVFMVCETFAAALASALGTEIEYSSHQHGHLHAALIGNKAPSHFLAVHLSGGTSEVLDVTKVNNDFDISIAGKTLDISAGKLIDRIGVKLGYKFPSGKYLEELAASSTKLHKFKISVKGSDFNFSGIETLAAKAIDEENIPLCDIARGIEHAIAKTLAKALLFTCENQKTDTVLFFGGVICNSYIRSTLKSELSKSNIHCIFANKEYSGDNACGLAVHACESYLKENE